MSLPFHPLAELDLWLFPLRYGVSSPGRLALFLRDLGVAEVLHDGDLANTPLGDLVQALESVEAALTAATQAEGSGGSAGPATLDVLTSVAPGIVRSLLALGDIDPKRFPGQLASVDWRRVSLLLPDHLTLRYIEVRLPVLFASLGVLGVFRESEDGAYPLWSIDYDQVEKLIGDPGGTLRAEYGWGDSAGLRHSRILGRLWRFAQSLGLPADLRPMPAGVAARHYPDGGAAVQAVTFPVYRASSGGARGEVRALLSVVPDASGTTTPDALLVTALAQGAFEGTQALTPGWELTVGVEVDATGALGLVVSPRGARLDGTPPVLRAAAELSGEPSPHPPEEKGTPAPHGSEEPEVAWLLLGDAGGTRLECAGLLARLELLGTVADPELVATVRLASSAAAGRGVRLVVDAADLDGFLAAILSDLRLEGGADLEVSWSSKHGFRGAGAALEVVSAQTTVLGPVRLDRATFGVVLAPAAMSLYAHVQVGFAVGPFTASVAGLGVEGTLGVRKDRSGNLGNLDLGVRFRPPVAASLEIDAPLIQGGGTLLFDPGKQQYGGQLRLRTPAFGMDATGLLQTKIPGGGWALYFSLFATFSPAIQLGFGFGLSGVGGVLAVNRQLDAVALRNVVHAGTLDVLLFPEEALDPATLFETVGALFPVHKGSIVFGPALQLTFAEGLVTASLGVYICLPSPVVIALAGRMTMSVPGEATSDADTVPALLDLRMDVAGAADLASGTVAVDARITGTLTLLKLSGDMAFRASFKERPGFLLSIGGFHPAFEPPGDLLGMERITTGLSFAVAPDISVAFAMQAYFAVTSNTVQLGAACDAEIAVGSLGSARGAFSFDALMTLRPFHVDARLVGDVRVELAGVDVLGARAEVLLAGPGPWVVSGTVYVALLRKEKEVAIPRITLGDTVAGPRPVVVKAWEDHLRPEVGRAENWAQVGVGSVRFRRSADASTVCLDPSLPLTFRQRAIPLDRRLDRVGADAIDRAGTFRLHALRAGGSSVNWTTTPLDDDFAPAAWKTMSEAEKLAAPSFERMPCGATAQPQPTLGAKVLASVSRVNSFDLSSIR